MRSVRREGDGYEFHLELVGLSEASAVPKRGPGPPGPLKLSPTIFQRSGFIEAFSHNDENYL